MKAACPLRFSIVSRNTGKNLHGGEGEKMMWCPMARQDCRKTDCAWFHEGECAAASLPDLVEKLEDVDEVLQGVKGEIGGITSSL